ncbi:MAG: GH3 auxin-responsive promoter family protein [Flavobacteriales bacterium]
MSIKLKIIKIASEFYAYKIRKWSSKPVETQQKVFKNLISQAKNTAFGKEHRFDKIQSYKDFKQNVPLRDYEGLRSYIDLMVEGHPNILWKGKPLYFAKTSGTTSGAKYIPISKESISYHIRGAQDSIVSYIHETGNTSIFSGKMIFLQGSPVLQEKNGIKIGRLSGIVAHYIPFYAKKNRMPSWKTNCIEDWETKIHKIVEETLPEKMTVISGIPPWIQNYFELLIKESKKETISEIFPQFTLLATGGVNFEPYRSRFKELVGKNMDLVETYPASEGFIAYQDRQTEKGLLLLLNHGIFYEFILMESYFDENPVRISIEDVELHKDYAIVLNTNAGLWGYLIGDTVQFVNKNPYRIMVSGRVKHFISAFGEHVISHEVEYAMKESLKKHRAQINEFTVAPQVNPLSGLPYHEWFVEFEKEPDCLNSFAKDIDKELRKKNVYYDDLILSKMLREAIVTKIKRGGFKRYMKSIGKLGGQNKIPRLSNNRKIADQLSDFIIHEK